MENEYIFECLVKVASIENEITCLFSSPLDLDSFASAKEFSSYYGNLRSELDGLRFSIVYSLLRDCGFVYVDGQWVHKDD